MENGVGTPGLVEKARTKLVAAGFQFINGGNASPFNADPSVDAGAGRYATRASPAAAGWPRRWAPGLLGHPEDRGQTVADVIVLLGSDFTP